MEERRGFPSNEVEPQKGAKQQKKAKDSKDKRAKSVESWDKAEVHQGPHTWALQLKMEGAPIPWDAIIWESQRGHATHLAETLKQPLLLPRDMNVLRRFKQPNLFLSLKRDLAMVSNLTYF